MVRSTREDPIGFSAQVGLILVSIGIKGFELFGSLNTLFDNEVCHSAPRALCEETDDFKTPVARVFEDGINDLNLTEG